MAERLFACGRDELLQYGPPHFYAAEQPDGRPVAESFAEHNRRVLEGEQLRYERRILNAAGDERLVEVTLVPLPSTGARLMRASMVDVTEQRRAQEQLAAHMAILATEHELTPDGIRAVDAEHRIISVNRRFAEMFDIPAELLAVKDDRPVVDWIAGKMADPAAFLDRDGYLYDHPDETGHEEVSLANGRVLDRYSAPMRRPDGGYAGRMWFLRDITERKETERALLRLNRALRTLSRGNEVVVRAASEATLLNEMCSVIVEIGGFRMAWVGTVQHDARKSITPVAQAGDIRDFLERAPVSWSDDPNNICPCGRAVNTGEPQVIEDFAADPALAPLYKLAQDYEFSSCAALPLKNESGVFATLAIYAHEPGAFDGSALAILQELAGDLAYGIKSLREQAKTEEMERRWRISLEATIGAIASTVEMRDPYTAGHQQRVATLAVAIARELHLPEQQVRGIQLAGIIHDVGKISVPAEILSKPGRLSPLEFQLIQAHAKIGHDIVDGVDFPWPIAAIVLQHHERLDGSGYPQGLTGEAMLPEAKILAVADVVEAMMSRRPYREALGLAAALAEIESGKGRLYDPAAVDACLSLFRQRGFELQ